MHSLFALTLTAFTVLLWPGASTAGDTARERATLSGVRAIHVRVEELHEDLKHGGLSVESLRADAELRLRSAGIPVATQVESSALPGGPYLSIKVVGFQLRPIFGYAAHVAVSLEQNVRLERDGSLAAIATRTWSLETLVAGSSTDTIRKTVRDLVDRFASAYVAVNPR